jgi:hypothetical protein
MRARSSRWGRPETIEKFWKVGFGRQVTKVISPKLAPLICCQALLLTDLFPLKLRARRRRIHAVGPDFDAYSL